MGPPLPPCRPVLPPFPTPRERHYRVWLSAANDSHLYLVFQCCRCVSVSASACVRVCRRCLCVAAYARLLLCVLLLMRIIVICICTRVVRFFPAGAHSILCFVLSANMWLCVSVCVLSLTCWAHNGWGFPFICAALRRFTVTHDSRHTMPMLAALHATHNTHTGSGFLSFFFCAFCILNS